jgi:hypothetical protein
MMIQAPSEAAAGTAPLNVPQWAVYELLLQSAREVGDPLRDVRVQVSFTGPGGTARSVEAFWDGDGTWRARFCPTATGRWRYRTVCSDPANTGLHDRSGGFECWGPRTRGALEARLGGRAPGAGTEPSAGDENPLYRHGPPRLSPDRHSLIHADGTPFFWLGDTAWNGAMRSEEAGWERYLADRRAKGFSVLQVVMTPFRAALADREGRVAFTGVERIAIDPVFFQRMDHRLTAANRRGLVVAPVLLWAIRGEQNPGHFLPEEQAILLARYMVARYGAHHVIWILGGDGDYRGAGRGAVSDDPVNRRAAPRLPCRYSSAAERWRRIGRAVFGDRRDRLATMHPAGLHWIADEFREEPWYDLIGYQSGHGDAESHLRWLCEGPPSQEWKRDPPRPIINLEPNYEAHLAYQSRRPIDPHMVRRAAYWSLLVSPTAGVTYGHHGVWWWSDGREIPLDHPQSGEAPPWHEAMEAPGSADMHRLREFFDSIPWRRLRPAPELLAEQPGVAAAERFIAAARTEEGDIAVLYVSEDRTVRLRVDVAGGMLAAWFDPRTGVRQPAESPVPDGSGTITFTTPAPGDWVLLLRGSS